MDTWTERLELPDGQYAVLLTRLPYDRWHRIERAVAKETTDAVFFDAVLRAFVWQASIRNYLTGETTEDVGSGDPEVIHKIRERTIELYLAWRKIAVPKVKAATELTNDETAPSDDSPQSEA